MWFLLLTPVCALLPHGFFGMIGPHLKKAPSLYHLFTGNGILQGVFLNSTTVTSVSHLIQTEKVKFETVCPLPTTVYHLPFQMLLAHLPWFPHMGTANTAILSIQDQEYALFERDLPYRIHIDMEHQRVTTIGKVKAPCHSISAHTWYDGVVRSHTYSILHQTVTFFNMNESFFPWKEETFRTRYVPLIHSHLRWGDRYVFTDSPLLFSWKHVLQGKFPFQAHSLPTWIHVTPEIYISNETFFLFHYGSFSETPDAFILYAPVYDTLDFSTVELYGKYRKLMLHKSNHTITMETNPLLETYNLDFPVQWKHYTLLRHVNLTTQTIHGFILCEGLEVVREYWTPLCILGEPVIENDSLLFFAYNETCTYFVVWPMEGVSQEHPVDLPGTLGFHSFFKKK